MSRSIIGDALFQQDLFGPAALVECLPGWWMCGDQWLETGAP